MPRFTFPHPFVLLVCGIALAAALTWIVPAGRYERRKDAATGGEVVIPGTYHAVPRQPVGPFAAVVDITGGLVSAAKVIFFVFLAGGAFAVVDRTGAFREAVNLLAERLQRRRALAIPITCAVFALGGVLENLQEEIIALVPVLLLLCRRLDFDPLTAAAMSIGSASVGSAFSPVNPFQVVFAQKLAELPQVSGASFRIVFLLLAVALWTWGVWRHAARLPVASRPTVADAGDETPLEGAALSARSVAILLLVVLTFVIFVTGVVRADWDFDQTAAVFFILGVAAGLIGRLGVTGTAEAFIEGFRSMAYAALLIGFARAIFVVLDQGQVVDTIVSALFEPLRHLPVALSAAGMVGVHTLIHFPVPSVSGQATLTLPLLVPLADLLGLSRQVVVLAYQYGAGLCELLTPTNGALMAILGAAGVRYEDWLRFTLPLYAGLVTLGLLAVWLGVAIGLR